MIMLLPREKEMRAIKHILTSTVNAINFFFPIAHFITYVYVELELHFLRLIVLYFFAILYAAEDCALLMRYLNFDYIILIVECRVTSHIHYTS